MEHLIHNNQAAETEANTYHKVWASVYGRRQLGFCSVFTKMVVIIASSIV